MNLQEARYFEVAVSSFLAEERTEAISLCVEAVGSEVSWCVCRSPASCCHSLIKGQCIWCLSPCRATDLKLHCGFPRVIHLWGPSQLLDFSVTHSQFDAWTYVDHFFLWEISGLFCFISFTNISVSYGSHWKGDLGTAQSTWKKKNEVWTIWGVCACTLCAHLCMCVTTLNTASCKGWICPWLLANASPHFVDRDQAHEKYLLV
jgi:hypothetical protein